MPPKRYATPRGARQKASLRSNIELQKPHKRSREPVTRSRMTVRGRFPSFKTGRMVDWESQLERRACYRFEFSPAVLSFKEQPKPIQFFLGDQYVKYTPDFELSLCNGEIWLVEIKPLARLHTHELRARLRGASEWYRSNGKKFVVITDSELIEPCFESNLEFLRHFQSYELNETILDQVRLWFQSEHSPTLSALHSFFGDKKTAYALLSHHSICIDLSQPFNPNSELFLPEEDSHEPLFFSYRTAPDFELS